MEEREAKHSCMRSTSISGAFPVINQALIPNSPCFSDLELESEYK